MLEKYEQAHFGYCPRVNCNGCKVLPVGRTDTPGQETVKLFCPSCLDIYTPPNSRFQSVDGAFFGTTFGCLFFMTFPELEVNTNLNNSPTASRSQLPPVTAADSTLSPSVTASTLDNISTKSGTTATIATTGNNNSSTPASDPPATSTAAPIESPTLLVQPTSINGFLTTNLAPGLGKNHIYEPRIYGFRVSERAKSGPRMRWLRMKPDNINELDETRRWHEQFGGDPDGDPDFVGGDEEGEEEEEEEADVEEEEAVGEIGEDEVEKVEEGGLIEGEKVGDDIEMIGAGSQSGKKARKKTRRGEGDGAVG